MFTGLVEELGRIEAIVEQPMARRLSIATTLSELPVGASLAVDGICLTVVELRPGQVDLVAAAETLARTTLGRLSVGDLVNLERPLQLGDRLGGHLVLGHVDGVGHVRGREERGEALDLAIEAPASLHRYFIAKGSVTVDGISLTINAVDDRGFSVSLIPHTRTATTLARKPLGAPVNLEVDLVGKYIERLLGPHRVASVVLPGLTREKLKEFGFAD